MNTQFTRIDCGCRTLQTRPLCSQTSATQPTYDLRCSVAYLQTHHFDHTQQMLPPAGLPHQPTNAITMYRCARSTNVVKFPIFAAKVCSFVFIQTLACFILYITKISLKQACIDLTFCCSLRPIAYNVYDLFLYAAVDARWAQTGDWIIKW